MPVTCLSMMTPTRRGRSVQAVDGAVTLVKDAQEWTPMRSLTTVGHARFEYNMVYSTVREETMSLASAFGVRWKWMQRVDLWLSALCVSNCL